MTRAKIMKLKPRTAPEPALPPGIHAARVEARVGALFEVRTLTGEHVRARLGEDVEEAFIEECLPILPRSGRARGAAPPLPPSRRRALGVRCGRSIDRPARDRGRGPADARGSALQLRRDRRAGARRGCALGEDELSLR